MKIVMPFLLCLVLSLAVAAQNVKPTINPNTPKIAALQVQKQQEEEKLKNLLTRYTEDYSEVIITKQKIANIDKEIAALSPVSEKVKPLSGEEISLLLEITTLRTKLQLCGYTEEDEGCKNGSIKTQLAIAYQKAVRYPSIFNSLLADAFEKYDKLRTQTKSAAQVSQIADEQNAELMRVIVLQNQRIIELLEKILNKK